MDSRFKMRSFKRIFISPFILWALLFAQSTDDRGFIVKVGDPCPDFQLELANGTSVSLSDLKGKVVVLQFTASWCSVCRVEMPHLEKEVWQVFKHQEFMLIGVDRDEPLEVVKQFAKEMKITYPLALDPGADIFAKFAHKESGVTRNVVIDQTGKIRFLTRLYAEKEFKEMIEVIEQLLKGTNEDIH